MTPYTCAQLQSTQKPEVSKAKIKTPVQHLNSGYRDKLTSSRKKSMTVDMRLGSSPGPYCTFFGAEGVASSGVASSGVLSLSSGSGPAFSAMFSSLRTASRLTMTYRRASTLRWSNTAMRQPPSGSTFQEGDERMQ